MHASFLIIGGGLSGLAAAIRLARFQSNVLLLEKHSRLGGLNSYYYRNKELLETGLHAITNYAPKEKKNAPFNKLLRQLKIHRREFGIKEQKTSRIHFNGGTVLNFSNDFNLLKSEIESQFKSEIDNFVRLVDFFDQTDPFSATPYTSARSVLAEYLKTPLLVDMLLCPVSYYGSCWENDIDLNQFIILFRSIFQEGLFRPEGTIKDLLDLLKNRYLDFGGRFKLNTAVKTILHDGSRATGVMLENGERITCDCLISTAGIDETRLLLGIPAPEAETARMSFTENIFLLDPKAVAKLPEDLTILFYNNSETFTFQTPQEEVDLSSGVICMPHNFQENSTSRNLIEVRTTHLANFDLWNTISRDKKAYDSLKTEKRRQSALAAGRFIGQFENEIVFQDSFSPVTIKNFTGKIDGAVYGSPHKVASGDIGYENLFIAGTDQGFLGIVGSMLSGVSMVNQNILIKL